MNLYFKKNHKTTLLLSTIFVSLVFFIICDRSSFDKEIFKYYKNDSFNKITIDYNDDYESKREYIYTDIDKINSVLSYLSNVKISRYNNISDVKIEHQIRISTLKGNTITILIFNNNSITVSCITDNGNYLKHYKVLDNSLSSNYIIDILNR